MATALTQISGYAHVAERYGFEEAVFLDSIVYWFRTNRANDRNFRDGRWWTYNSIKAFEEIFPWWNSGQIRRIIARCREKGALLAGNYNEDQRDRTAWYTPSDELLELYGESANCICRKRQMEVSEPSGTFAENSECNIRNTCSNHVETDMTPYSPPEGDEPKAKAKNSRRGKSAPVHDPEAFETFWKAYPRKDDRKAAIRAWDKLKPDRELCRVMYAALKRQRSSEQWAEADGRYIPMFSTWLNGRKWENQGVDLSLLSRSRDASGGWAPDPEAPA